ncbi:MAG TPA: bifunctional D-glycero-beta-D-manno-heptose-7-phosphate kinase/D-glycero-beta-D-manno-heptose 1-phosphate adenylyltransferase HldE [Gammaproteobacteria bacterium]|nr:bifunctional D-glycero-beta-D-manno-heptose-7-phosphate kinase/D-glycero-beta-D-manno-heptose 1-phosphate adenylyltransferase HldE [Gammaproteobacteria bacterium]
MKNQFPEFNKASVLVIGDLMLDRYWFGDAARISPEAPVPIINIRQIDERPGGAGNVALNTAALGVQTSLIGVIGKDDTGRILTEQLAAASISHDIHCLAGIPTITKHRVISRHQQLIRMDFEETFPAFDPSKIIDYYAKGLLETQLVILSDYGKGTLICAPQLIQLAKKAGITVLVDPKGADFSIYHGADIITPNFKEFEAIVGPCHNEQEIIKKGQELLKKYDIQALLLTRGEHGMTLIQQDAEELHFPAHAREVFDVTGAGDTVIAVLGASLAAGSTLPQAMMLANLAAGLVVAKLGAATVSLPELQAALKDTTIISSGIVNDEQLLIAISEARTQGKRIVFTNGCFDILHAGHVTYLQQAKQLGDLLIVAVNDDESVKRLKGTGRPINNTLQRMAVLAGLGVVDWVVPFQDDTPERLLKLLKPDVLVKGGDYTTDQVVGAGIVQTYGGDVRVLGEIKNLSTTSIIDRVIKQVK